MRLHSFHRIFHVSRVYLLSLLPLALFSSPVSVSAGNAVSGTVTAHDLRGEIVQLAGIRDRIKSRPGSRETGTDEQMELSDYITHLDFRIQRLCSQLLMQHGERAISGLPCPAGTGLIPGIQTPASKSSTEKVEELDDALVKSLGEFDEFINGEQEKIASSRTGEPGANANGDVPDNGAGTGPGRYGGTAGPETYHGSGGPHVASNPGGTEQGRWGSRDIKTGSSTVNSHGMEKGRVGQEGAYGAHGQWSQASGPGNEGRGVETGAGQGSTVRDSGVSGGTAPGQGSGASGPGTGIYQDDDIVARQLREAAESESDPELKKMLWDEYYRYKRGDTR